MSQAQQVKLLNIIEQGRTLVLAEEDEPGLTFVDSAVRPFNHKSAFFRSNYYQFRHFAASHGGKEASILNLYFDSMLRADQHVSNSYPKEYAKTLIDRADMYLRKQEFNRAFESLYLARKIASEHRDHQISFRMHSIMGNAMYRQRNFKEASINYSRAYRGAVKILLKDDSNKYKHTNGQANNTALCFMRLKLYDSASHYYGLALESIDSFRRFNPDDHVFIKHSTGVVLANQASLARQQGYLDDAINLYEKSISHNLDSVMMISEALISIGHLIEVYVQQNDFERAKRVLEQHKLLIDSTQNAFGASGIQKAKWKYFLAKGDTASAYKYHLIYRDLTTTDEISSRTLVDIDFEKELDKYQDIWDLRILKEESRVQQTVLWVALGLLVLFLLVFGYIRRHNNQLKALNAQINLQNERLSLSIKSLEQSQEENKKIMSVVAHDLRSPIGGFSGITELLLEKDYYEAEDRELIELIHNASNEALGFVDELLQVNQDNTDFEKEHTDMVLLLEQSVLLQKHKARDKAIRLNVVSQPAWAWVNKEKIGRVLGNIISNAIKFSYDKSMIEIGLKTQEDICHIWVKDSGMGIPEVLQDKLFEVGKAKQRLGTKGEATHGLGMVITRQLVEAHNGHIWFESEEGVGTTFYVELPVNNP